MNSHPSFDTGTRRCTRVHTYIYSAFIQAHYTLGSSTQQQGGGGKGCVALPTSPSDRKNLVPRSVRTSFAPVFADIHLFVQTWNSDRKIRGQNRGSRDPPPGNRHGTPAPLPPDPTPGPRSAPDACHGPARYSRAKSSLTGIPCDRGRAILTFAMRKREQQTTVTNIDLHQKK